MEIQIDMYQTLALSVVVLMLGQFLKQKINFLEKFCIPSPVVGGLIFSVLTCILYSTGVVEFTFDDTLREVCMVFFFTSVGFQANLKVLKSNPSATAISARVYLSHRAILPRCKKFPLISAIAWSA